MKKVYISALSIAVAALLTITGCKKDSPPVSSNNIVYFSMTADNSIVPFTSVTKPGGPAVLSIAPNVAASGGVGMVWTAAGANVSSFKFDAKKDGTAFEIIAAGIANANLFSNQGSTYPNIPVGNYTNVTVHAILSPSLSNGLSLILQGVYVNKTGNQIPVEVDVDDNAEIIATANNINVDGSSNLSAALALHLDQLSAGITTSDMDQATRSTVNTVSNSILISNASNVNIYAKILANIGGAGGASVVAVQK